jgi:hypothetical protein
MHKNTAGFSHILLPLTVVVLVAVGGTFLYVKSKAEPASSFTRNPYTVQCPGNRVLYNTPRKATATAAARERVFGKPYPNANVDKTTFMGHELYLNKKIIPCLKAVEWDLRHVRKYRTDYKVNEIYGASELNSQNPAHYFHAYGGAVDINPKQNPHCRGGCAHDMPKQWVKAFKAHGFYWGGKFPNYKDYMHFEWHGQK